MSSVAIEESSTLTSHSVQYRLMHKWTIKDFSATYLVESPGQDRYRILYSTSFCSSQDKGTQFRMMLRPRGVFEKHKNDIVLYLDVYRKPPFTYRPMQINCTFSFLNDANEKCYTKEFRRERKYLSGFPNNLAHTLLLDPANRLLPADQLTILAEVEVYPELVSQFGNDLLLAKRTWEARENIGVSLGTLENSRQHSDVILVLDKDEDLDYEEEEEEMAAHKNILSLHSPVFSAMFKTDHGEMMEPNEGCRFRIPDMENYVARRMFDFIYTGYVEDLEEYAEELYVAADKYGIIRLKELCCQSLCDQLDTYNAAELLAFADRHSIDQLKKACVDFIRHQKMEDIVLDKNWPLVEKLFIEELRLVKLKEKDEVKKEKTLEGSSSSNQPASAKYRLQHKWILTEFASTYLGQSPHTATYPEISSVWFRSALDRQIQFRLLLKPRGKSGVSKNAISLYLELNHHKGPTLFKSTEVNYKVSLLNNRNEKCHSQEYRKEFQHSAPKWGRANFLAHALLLDPANGLLPNDQLTILAEVDVFPNQLGSELPLGRIEWAARKNVTSSLGTLLDSGEYSDVLLVVQGQELAAHKNILVAQSPVFSAMFKSEMVEREEGRVLIQDIEIDVAKVLLRFIYTGVVEDLEKYAEDLLMAADKYGITLLKALCSQYLCGRVDTDNVVAMLTLADRHSAEQLKKVCVNFIRRHMEEMVIGKDWFLVNKLFIQELTQLKLKEKEEEKKKGEVKIPEASYSVN